MRSGLASEVDTGVRSKEHVGIVTSDTGTERFSFYVSPMKNMVGVEEGEYVVIDHPIHGDACPILTEVEEIRSYEEVVGSTLGDKSVRMVAVSKIIGCVDLRGEARPLSRLSVPPDPGSKVYRPYAEFLQDVFMRGPDGRRFQVALHVGMLEPSVSARNGDVGHLKFYLDAEDFGGRQFLITGMSGSGKTHAATVLAEELANRARTPVVVLDPFGEYTTIGFRGEQLGESLKNSGSSTGDYPFDFEVSIFAGDPDRVSHDIQGAVSNAGGRRRYSVTPVPDRWMKDSCGKSMDEAGDELREAVKPKHVSIVDARGLPPDERCKVFNRVSKALWSGRTDGFLDPFVLVVEDADSIDPDVIDRIASEGRKFGVSMCLITQRPSELSGRTLSQTGAFLIGRTTDAGDLDLVGRMAEEKLSILHRLKPGEFIANGVNMMQPVKVFVRDRCSLTA